MKNSHNLEIEKQIKGKAIELGIPANVVASIYFDSDGYVFIIDDVITLYFDSNCQPK